MCEPREVIIGDRVKETPAYRKWARDREVRGEVASRHGTLVVVRNAGGWELSIHKDWLEIDHDYVPEPVTLIPTPWALRMKTPKFCQHCGEKL